MSRTVGVVDAALILNNAYFLRISAWVNNHNLFSLLGWLWLKLLPFGTEFFRVNLLSSLFGAATVYLIFLTCLRLSQDLFAAVAAAVALMLSHSLWWHSTMLEVYTLNTFLLALILHSALCFLQSPRPWGLYAAAFFWGLGVSNHILMALLAPAFAVLLIVERKRLRFAHLAAAAGLLAAGLALFFFVAAKSLLRYHSLPELFAMLTGGSFRTLMFRNRPRGFWWANYLILLIYQYPSAALAFLCCGIVALVRRREKYDCFLIAALLPQLIWSANYYVWDMYAFALPTYFLMAPLICRGLAAIRRRLALRRMAAVSILIPLLLYPNAFRLQPLRGHILRYPEAPRVLEAYDPLVYFLDPDKRGYDDVERYVSELFARLPERAIYYDVNHDYPIVYYYQQIRGLRPDLQCPIHFVFWITEEEAGQILSEIRSHLRAGEPVFMTRFMLDNLSAGLSQYEVSAISILGRPVFRVEPGR
jgi:hypothetical protein